jgi:hypothetical protein
LRASAGTSSTCSAIFPQPVGLTASVVRNSRRLADGCIAARAPRKGSGECDHQPSAHCGFEFGTCRSGPIGGAWVGNLRELQIVGSVSSSGHSISSHSSARGQSVRRAARTALAPRDQSRSAGSSTAYMPGQGGVPMVAAAAPMRRDPQRPFADCNLPQSDGLADDAKPPIAFAAPPVGRGPSVKQEEKRPSQHRDDVLMERWRTSNLGAEFRNLGRRSVGLRIRVIVVRPLERWQVAAEVQFEVARNTVTDTTDLGTARLRSGPGQG